MTVTTRSAALARILICRTDNIGDVVLTLPLAGFLKSQFPQIQIDFLVRAYAAPVVALSQFVDQVHALEQVGDVETFLASGKWTCVIFAFPQRKLAKAAKRAKIPYRVGSSHRLYHWLYCNKLAHFSRVNSPLHEAQLNFALLKPLGMQIQPSLQQIIPWYGLRVTNDMADPRLASFRQEAGMQVILHVKSNGNGREWPLARYLELTQQLQAEKDIVFWLTGSAAEGEFLQQHAAPLLAQPNVRNVCGQFDLAGLAAFIAQADGLIASGTGPLHLSAALGRPTLGLFPPIKPIHPARWGALGQQAQDLCAEQVCQTCTGVQQCECMQKITAQQVAQIVLMWRTKR